MAIFDQSDKKKNTYEIRVDRQDTLTGSAGDPAERGNERKRINRGNSCNWSSFGSEVVARPNESATRVIRQSAGRWNVAESHENGRKR